MNKIVIIGRLGKDPETRTTTTGKNVVSFSVGVTREFDKEQTDWFRVSAWGKTGEFVQNYLGKGRLVAVAGRMESRSYTDKDGNKREAWELTADSVQGLDRPKDEQGQEARQSGATTQAPASDWDPFVDE